jgi:hypothetical protein
MWCETWFCVMQFDWFEIVLEWNTWTAFVQF